MWNWPAIQHHQTFGPSDELTRLEDFVFQFSNNVWHEVGVGIGEEWHRGHQWATVVVDHVLS